MPSLELGRAVCGDLEAAESREWLVTNGLGGFASGTVAGTLTRRYHGLLFAARKPPVGRLLLAPKLEPAVVYDGASYALGTDRWHDETVAPLGYALVERFALEGTVPVWTFALGDAQLERRIWMEQDANRTYVAFRVARARRPLALTLRAFANHRELHAATHAGDWQMDVSAGDDGVHVIPYPGATELWIRADAGSVVAEHTWYRDHLYTEERARGLDDSEDHLLVATFTATLAAGETMTVVFADAPIAEVDGAAALERRRTHEMQVLAAWRDAQPRLAPRAPGWVSDLVLAADAFIVRRRLADDPEARSVIAGYHWFADWGRDTTISLPGLALVTGRTEIARKILVTFARFVDGGMIPNYFPDEGSAPEYNTVDAALWYVEAVRRYWETTQDTATLRDVLFPAVAAIVAGYRAGTRYAIGVDPQDGLLRAGVPGVQVTWMDAKVDDHVITPRIGKPVEVNALWWRALETAATFARTLGVDPGPYTEAAQQAANSFARFVNTRTGWLLDVLDGPDGDDPSLRPNQLFAVVLGPPLDRATARAIVDICEARLWTPRGMRSLAPDDPRYVGTYGGDRERRDGAYHQGIAWGWLLGTFALAHRRVYDDPEFALAFLGDVADELAAAGLGTLGEIADGDAPFTPRGAIAQAWSVAETLRAWHELGGRR